MSKDVVFFYLCDLVFLECMSRERGFVFAPSLRKLCFKMHPSIRTVLLKWVHFRSQIKNRNEFRNCIFKLGWPRGPDDKRSHGWKDTEQVITAVAKRILREQKLYSSGDPLSTSLVSASPAGSNGSGSTGPSNFLISKCKCGPEDLPVFPSAPITSPCFILAPS